MSNLKLIICSEKLFHPDNVDEIHFGGDLIRALSDARLIKESSVNVLGQMLQNIGRADLAKSAREYEEDRGVLGDNNNDLAEARSGRSEAQQHEHSGDKEPVDCTKAETVYKADGLWSNIDAKLGEESMSTEDYSDSQSSSQQSSVSMTDEEKLLENKKVVLYEQNLE